MNQRKMQSVVDDLKAKAKLGMSPLTQLQFNNLVIESIINLSNANAQLIQQVEQLENRNPKIG